MITNQQITNHHLPVFIAYCQLPFCLLPPALCFLLYALCFLLSAFPLCIPSTNPGFKKALSLKGFSSRDS
jgi:hypothetical protein